MKKLILLLACLYSFCMAQSYRSPESAVYDLANRRWVITNAANGTSGGSIVWLDTTGRIQWFAQPGSGINSPKGITWVDGMIFTVDINAVHQFESRSMRLVKTKKIDDAVMLNDIAFNGRDSFYITDIGQRRIYQMNFGLDNYINWLDLPFSNPNGLIVDRRRNRLLVVDYNTGAQVRAIDLSTKAVTVLTSFRGNDELDGITVDECGRYYISSWTQKKVFRYDSSFTKEEVIAQNLDGPADIFYNARTEELAIPLFSIDKVNIMDMKVGAKFQKTWLSESQAVVQAALTNAEQWLWTLPDNKKDSTSDRITIDLTGTGPDTFEVCLEAFSSCKTAKFCDTLIVKKAVGSHKASAESYFSIWPNPSNNAIFQLNTPLAGNLTIYSSVGMPVKKAEVKAGVQAIELVNLPGGVYTLVLEAINGNRSTQKIIIH
jgi:hypothetical protein